jgi:hypothetical protein
MANAYAKRALFVMRTYRNHSALKPGIANAWHGEQKLARKESRVIHGK